MIHLPGKISAAQATLCFSQVDALAVAAAIDGLKLEDLKATVEDYEEGEWIVRVKVCIHGDAVAVLDAVKRSGIAHVSYNGHLGGGPCLPASPPCLPACLILFHLPACLPLVDRTR